jgi:outer membrane protein assembly factor BamD
MSFDCTCAAVAQPRAGSRRSWRISPTCARRATVGKPLFVALVAIALAAGCASAPRKPPTGTPDPDKFLFERGSAELNDKDWFTAREYFKQLVDSYPQSQYRGDAKLGLGDTYVGEGTAESYVLAINEFREFLSFYPTHKRVDYAQYKLGMCHFYQMRDPMRDQTETVEAIKELSTFIERFPNATRSALYPEAKERLREARDRIGDHELGVGIQYHRTRWYPGAIDRLKGLIDKDPEFTRRDAALFYLADSYDKVGRPAEALPLFDRLIKEFERSEYLAKAQLRATAIRAQMDKKSGATPHEF